MPVPLKKRVLAKRNEQGELWGEVTIEGDPDPIVGALEKLAKGTRDE
jgi:hypothetical protein